MCRLAAFPPGITREYALWTMDRLETNNRDGFGYAYTKKGQFIVHRWPEEFSKVSKREKYIFRHMPYNGWTIAHLRLASCGKPTYKNTHPFVKGDVCVCHNGCFSIHEELRPIANKFGHLSGETDSEVAAWVISNIGCKKFYKNFKFGSTYLALHRDGQLSAWSQGGDLEISTKHGCLASSFGASEPSTFLKNSFNYYAADGKVIEHEGPTWGNQTNYPAYSGYGYGMHQETPSVIQPELPLTEKKAPIIYNKPKGGRHRLVKSEGGYLWKQED